MLYVLLTAKSFKKAMNKQNLHEQLSHAVIVVGVICTLSIGSRDFSKLAAPNQATPHTLSWQWPHLNPWPCVPNAVALPTVLSGHNELLYC